MDFMSNNMFFDNSINSQLTSSNNKNEFIIDVYSDPSYGTNSNFNSIFDVNGTKDAKSKNSQTRMWIMGNKIIQITTGLFSNVCVEELPVLTGKSTTRQQKDQQQQQKTNQISQYINIKSIKTQAIDIPQNTQTSCATTSTVTNESIASTGGSSLCTSNNNSCSSTSLLSNYQQIIASSVGTTNSNNMILPENNSMKLNDDQQPQQISSSLNSNKFFDSEIFSSTNEKSDLLNSTELPTQQQQQKINVTDNGNETAEAIGRRKRLIKRRYKSGLPLSTDRAEEDLVEESYLKQYSDIAINKQSKDDTGNKNYII